MELSLLAARLKGAKAEGNTVAQRRKCLQTFLADLGETTGWLALLDGATLDDERPHWPELALLAIQLISDVSKPSAKRAAGAGPAVNPSLAGSVDALDMVLRLADARHEAHGLWMFEESMKGPRGLLAALLDLASGAGLGAGDVASSLVRKVLLRRVLVVEAYAALLEPRDARRLLSLCSTRLRRSSGVGPGAEDDAAYVRWTLVHSPEALREHVVTSAPSSEELESFFAELLPIVAFGGKGITPQPAEGSAGSVELAQNGASAATPMHPAQAPSMAVVDAVLASLHAFWRGLLLLSPRYILVLARPMMPALAAKLRDCARNEAYALARSIRLVCLVRRQCRLDGRPPEPLPPSLLGALSTKLSRGYTRLRRDGNISRQSFVLLDLAAELLAANTLDVGDTEETDGSTRAASTSAAVGGGLTVWALYAKHTAHADLSWLLPLTYVAVARFGWSRALLGQTERLLAHILAVAEANGGPVGMAAIRAIGALSRARAAANVPNREEFAEAEGDVWRRAGSAVLQQLREHKPSSAGRACCFSALRTIFIHLGAQARSLQGELQVALLDHARPSGADVGALMTLLAGFARPGKKKQCAHWCRRWPASFITWFSFPPPITVRH
jgi:hypothetical protein